MGKSFSLRGYDHVKVVVSNLPSFEKYLENLGFIEIPGYLAPSVLEGPHSIWGSGEAFFCLYSREHPLAKPHFTMHGDTVFDLSFLVESTGRYPQVVEGAGKMRHTLLTSRSFQPVASRRGVLRFDHNTINVEAGQLETQVNRYQNEFGFEKGQYFDIKGTKTGLYSWVTRSEDRSVQIPFNVAADPKSQIQEFIDVHRGAGVQHLALVTRDLLSTMKAIQTDTENQLRFLEIPDTYYELVSKRMTIKESFEELKKYRLLVDQDSSGYLLQIFTQVVFGGFFFELIQREGCTGFGEGNFTALFESMELDQQRRGVL